MKKKIKNGFTLIELLVVIAIISILSSILLVAIDPNSKRLRADDAKILSMLNSIQKALELYRLDKGYYPKMSAHTYHEGLNKDEFNAALHDYMPIDIKDPIWGPNYWGQTNGAFYYSSAPADNYQHYGMMVRLIHPNETDLEVNDGGYWSIYYEVGEDPKYCMNKYTGTDASWWYGATHRCKGGN